MEGTKKLVSIIIRTKDEGKYIGRVLETIFAQDFYNFEIIIVDSGSNDDTLKIAGRFDVTLLKIKEEEFSYGFAINYGASRSRGDFLVILSGHAIPADRYWLGKLLAGFTGADIAAVWGRCLPLPGANPVTASDISRFWGPRKSKWFSNTNCAIRRNMWEIMKFDEKIPYSEDCLWEHEVKKNGYCTRYLPQAAVYHSHNDSLSKCYKRACVQSLAFHYIREKTGIREETGIKGFIASPLIRLLGGIAVTFLYMLRPKYIYRIDWYIKVPLYRLSQAWAAHKSNPG